MVKLGRQRNVVPMRTWSILARCWEVFMLAFFEHMDGTLVGNLLSSSSMQSETVNRLS